MSRGLDPLLVAAYDAQADLVATWLDGLTEADLERPSSLPGWRIAELVAHLVVASDAFTHAVDRSRPLRGTSPFTVAQYVGAYPAAAAQIAAREAATAADLTRSAARADFATSVGRVRSAAGALDGDPVLAARRGPIRASDLLRTRVLELVVHAIDADVQLDRQALRVTVRMLAEVLAERHPGKSVEVRVPPYAAVQVGSGLSHSRGTPPNVVECAPMVFVAVVTGRRAWTDAVAAGDVRASGSRADLRPYLPLL